MTATQTRIRASSDVCLRQAGEEGILYDTRHHKVHIINSTAAFIWQCCEETGDRDEILNALVRRFDVEMDLAEQDLDQILTTFRELELIDLTC